MNILFTAAAIENPNSNTEFGFSQPKYITITRTTMKATAIEDHNKKIIFYFFFYFY